MFLVRGDLVGLRALDPADADTLWGWQHDPEVVRWLEARYPESPVQTRARFDERPPNGYDRVQLGIETLDDGRLVGYVALRDASPETGEAELDLYLGEKDTWGRGLGTDAVRALCRYGFEEMRLHKVSLTVVAENAGARRVYEKVGFVEEGRLRDSFRRDGRWHDVIAMGLLEHEFRDGGR